MKGSVMLALGILSEALATVFLKNALGFTVLVPSLICIVLYGACTFFIAQSVQSLKVSIAYATWYGAGIVAAAGLSVFLYQEALSGLAFAGIVVTIIGLVLANLSERPC